uniref:Intraflagellar transport 88 n=1 Tax=Nothobranchius furzeri TaxID=105023 RepID=A0A8C6LG96_NOTFU
MENVHQAAEEDDLYSGYNDFNPAFYSEFENDVGFQQAVRTTYGRRPPVRNVCIVFVFVTREPLLDLLKLASDGLARPMSAVKAAGYSSTLTRGSFWLLLCVLWSFRPEEKLKLLEKKINTLIEESCMAQSTGNLQLALDKAKEAHREERALVKQREQSGSADHINLDLTYSVQLNLANQYEKNEMHPEALSSYKAIVKNKMFSNAGRLKVNMGNIYYKQKNYHKAIKFYRMALDQISNAHKDMRSKIKHSIAVVFIAMGQYSDAITSLEDIMSETPNITAGFNLILCYHAAGDREKMKKAFQKLISVPLGISDEDKYIPPNDDTSSKMVIEAIKNDKLSQMERDLKARAEKYITTAAKLICPAMDASFASEFDWCVDMVKNSQYVQLANDLEFHKAMTCLRQKDHNQAKEILKTFEKKDSKMKSAAATNLSFIYFQEKDFDQADKYADLAMSADHYNPAALTNKGNTVFVKQDYEKAAEFYKEALRNDSLCTESLHNLGLAYKRLNHLEEALDCFLKLHAILKNSDQVMYQLADIYELMGDRQQAIKWLMQVICVTPTDPHVLAKLGKLHNDEGDKSQALHYYSESFRLFPCKIDVIEWLGVHYIESQFFEKATQYFERATLIQPTQVKWQLMEASCYRKSGNYQKALETYKEIHRKFPENVDCLCFLVRLSTDMGLKEVQEYATKLKKAEKMKEIREQKVKSGQGSTAGGRREGSGGSADSNHSSGSSRGERLSAKMRSLTVSNEPYEADSQKELDASYMDPLGPQIERPKTGAKKRVDDDDDFGDEELGDDLLPE